MKNEQSLRLFSHFAILVFILFSSVVLFGQRGKCWETEFDNIGIQSSIPAADFYSDGVNKK